MSAPQPGAGVAVGILPPADPATFRASLASVLAHTPGEVPVLVAGGADPDAARRAVEAAAGGRDVGVVAGGPAELAGAAGEADLALCDGRHLVGPGWLDGLRAATASDDTVATASALTLPRTAEDERAATAMSEGVRRHAARLRPRLERPSTACALIRRDALALAGPLDEGFAERCAGLALLHVAADEVLAVAVEEADAEPSSRPGEIAEHRAARLAAHAPLERALARARRGVDGLSVTIDGRTLTETMAGTQVHTLELIAALHRTEAVRLRVVLPPDVGATARELLRSLGDVELLDARDVGEAVARSAVVHRPYQVSGPIDLLVMRYLGERLVVTHQDLLNYHDPAYHRDRDGWEAHRRLTREALAAADAVVTFSEHAAADLHAEDLVPDDRRRTIPIGTDHALGALVPEPRAPEAAAELADRPFLLCLGSDLHHKNRPFAIALLEALRADHGWDGALVLAGPEAAWGSSREHERALLDARPELAGAVITLPQVGEPEKAWLYRHAAAVAYPSTYEGFGLIPFESALAGVPCLFAARSALAETLPAELALLVPWDARRSAARAIGVLRDEAARTAWVQAARTAASGYTWDRTAAALIETYEAVITAPAREQASLAWTAMAADDRRGHFEGLYWQLHDEIGPTGHALVGEDGLLDEQTQRAIAALSRRKATRKPFLGALRLLHRLAERAPGGR